MNWNYFFKNNDDDVGGMIRFNQPKTIKDLKSKIKNEYDIPESWQRIYSMDSDDNYNELYDNQLLSNERSLILYNINKLKIITYIKRTKFEYYLKASDTILDLKKLIFKRFPISPNKMKIVNSNKIINNDKQLIEDFIPNLQFDISFDIGKIMVNILNKNDREAIYIDPFSYTDELYPRCDKEYFCELVINGKDIPRGAFIFDYLKNNDNIQLIYLNTKEKIRLKVKLGTSNTKIIFINPEEPISSLLKKLNICDKKTKFIFNGETYSMFSTLTFKEIGLTSDSNIYVNNKGLGPDYIIDL